MLSLSKICRELIDLKLQLFKNCQFRNSISNSCSFHYSFNLTPCKLYSTVCEKEENTPFPIDEISKCKISYLNCDEEKVSKIINEISLAKSRGQRIPNFIKPSDIIDLVECHSPTRRLKYLKYLFKKEKQKLHDVEKKQKIKDCKNMSIKNVTESDHIQYGAGKNTLLLRILKRSIAKFYDKKLANYALFGQKIVIDLDYNKYMWMKERKNCVQQLKFLYSSNRYSQDPYDLYFCNADPKTECVQYLHHYMPNINEMVLTLYEQSYLDVFPKENLVYLSPHAPETLKTYDHKAIYIIGAFVDTVRRDYVSMEKARKEGIKCYSLPLDEYVSWGSGSRSLTINQVFLIMQTMRDTGDWKEAFKHVPTRKLKRVPTDSEEAQNISDKLSVIGN